MNSSSKHSWTYANSTWLSPRILRDGRRQLLDSVCSSESSPGIDGSTDMYYDVEWMKENSVLIANSVGLRKILRLAPKKNHVAAALDA
jgi:hypothetical protein